MSQYICMLNLALFSFFNCFPSKELTNSSILEQIQRANNYSTTEKFFYGIDRSTGRPRRVVYSKSCFPNVVTCHNPYSLTSSRSVKQQIEIKILFYFINNTMGYFIDKEGKPLQALNISPS